MTKPFADLAKLPYIVRDEGNYLLFQAADFTGWYDATDDTIAAAATHNERKVPRAGALAVIAARASKQLRLEWTWTKTHATATRDREVVILIDHDPEKQSWRYRFPGDWQHDPALALAMFHGITAIRLEIAKPKPRHRK